MKSKLEGHKSEKIVENFFGETEDKQKKKISDKKELKKNKESFWRK